MYDRYNDASKFITPDKWELDSHGLVHISGEDNFDIAVDFKRCFCSFEEAKPFIELVVKQINELDNAVQRYDCRNGSNYDPNSDETPFVLELIELEKPDTITLSYFCTDVNSQFDAVFVLKDSGFHLRSFGTVKNIPDDWEENITTG